MLLWEIAISFGFFIACVLPCGRVELDVDRQWVCTLTVQWQRSVEFAIWLVFCLVIEASEVMCYDLVKQIDILNCLGCLYMLGCSCVSVPLCVCVCVCKHASMHIYTRVSISHDPAMNLQEKLPVLSLPLDRGTSRWCSKLRLWLNTIVPNCIVVKQTWFVADQYCGTVSKHAVTPHLDVRRRW